MTTPRAAAIKIARSHEPFDANEPIDIETAKIKHYGYLARLFAPGITAFLEEENASDSLNTTTQVGQFHDAFIASLWANIQGLMDTPDFHNAHGGALATLNVRNEVNFTSITGSLEAGLRTYLAVSSGVYENLALLHGNREAARPENALIVDRISKLNINLLPFYDRAYLPTLIHDWRPESRNLEAFGAQLQKSSDGGWRFKPGYPEAALMPEDLHGRMSQFDETGYRLKGDETIRLKDLEKDDFITVGCPISFEPQQGRELWGLYARHRQRIAQTRGLSQAAITRSSSA